MAGRAVATMTVSMIEMKLVAIRDANASMKESDFFSRGATGAILEMASSSELLDKDITVVVILGSLRGILRISLPDTYQKFNVSWEGRWMVLIKTDKYTVLDSRFWTPSPQVPERQVMSYFILSQLVGLGSKPACQGYRYRIFTKQLHAQQY